MDRVPGNIIEMTNRTNGLFVAPLFNLFFMAIFIRGASPLGTVLGSVYGFGAAFLIAFWQTLTGEPSPGFQWILPGFARRLDPELDHLQPPRGKAEIPPGGSAVGGRAPSPAHRRLRGAPHPPLNPSAYG